MLTSYCAAKGEAFCQRAFFAGLLSPPCLWLLWLAIRKLRTVAAIKLDSKPRGLKVPPPARPRHSRLPLCTVAYWEQKFGYFEVGDELKYHQVLGMHQIIEKFRSAGGSLTACPMPCLV